MPESEKPRRRYNTPAVSASVELPKETIFQEIVRDPETGPATIVGLGAAASKLFAVVEHGDFLMSLNEEHFKEFITIWTGSGWWIAIVGAIAWATISIIRHHSQPVTRQNIGPSWSLLNSCAFVAFIFGCMWAAVSSGGVPQVIASHSTGPCVATINTEKILAFREHYKFALVCYMSSPVQDPISDKNIFVSNLFTIAPGGETVAATPGPSAEPPPNPIAPIPVSTSTTPGAPPTSAPPQSQTPGPNFQIQIQNITTNFVVVLVPEKTTRDKITSLSDVLALNGKIIDARYYK